MNIMGKKTVIHADHRCGRSWLIRTVQTLALAGLISLCRAETIVLGAEDDWLPFSGIIDGQARGFAVDVVREAYQAAGIEVQFESLPYARCMAESKAGKILGCFDAARNSLLEPHYLWHARPLFTARINIYALNSSNDADLTPKDLEKQEVGVTNGYEYGEAFDTNPLIVRSVSNQDIQGFRKLVAGRVKYMVAYEKVTDYLLRRYPAIAGRFKAVGMTAEPALYIAFSRHFPRSAYYVDRFNSGLDLITKNGRYKAIESKWFP
ncbi:substrate-binding periplasmic protein [Chitinimonas sp.]|uniref:substrate-binding periplasmic protein n=1 Tax=Chitinimonas sp. TaxID=1934313 RepID=UPI0035B0AF67